MISVKVTEQQKKAARKANLFEFLRTHHADAIELDKHGKTLRLTTNHSISIKDDYSGYLDFATNEHGNGIDLLTRYFGYNFQEAVLALCGTPEAFSFSSPLKKTTEMKEKKVSEKIFQLPPAASDYRRMMAYLTKSRQLPASLVQSLIDKRLLYQAAKTNNAVFVSAKRDFAELRGTLTVKPFHGIVANSRPDGCWCFSTGADASIVYICESAIDAMSLAVFRDYESAYYVSIGGAGKQAAIDRIKGSGLQVVIATDNDEAGDACRDNNAECKTIRPQNKDWNDDL